MAGSSSGLYAYISTWRLRPGFGEGLGMSAPAVICPAERWIQFLRMAAPPRAADIRFHGMVRCWAVSTEGERMTFVNLFSSRGGMEEWIGGPLRGGELGSLIARYLDVVWELSGPVTDIFHLNPVNSALRALDAVAGAVLDEAPDARFVSVSRWRARLPAADRVVDSRSGGVATTANADLWPQPLPPVRRYEALSSWAVETGDDTVAFVSEYATEDGRERAWADAQDGSSGQLGEYFGRRFEPIERSAGTLIDILHLSEQG